MTDSKTAIYIHDTLINEFGGSKGVRDMGALDAALNRPYATLTISTCIQLPLTKQQQYSKVLLLIIHLLMEISVQLTC